ncbi:hypothetical protein BDM02DRAFT_3120580 [Thelephora ganbajun]|uniref:Uncharacterized protein n=1 Tax=Thelephora ganbajun TaxID=370292 RepID=A0ACB6Z6S6_THEGA|nr:hypothetical protein BDM02DRAFT_3120580 [Thelephora ganbajun]
MFTVETTRGYKAESIRPPEILCRILQFAIGKDGVKTLLPFTHVSSQWRRAALGDSSLWTTIYLEHTTTPLLDMVLARAGNRFFTVHVNHRDLDRLAKLWKLVYRIEELHYTTGLRQLVPFLSSLGPAPNLKVLHLRPQPTIGIGEPRPLISLPDIFSAHLPSLRDLALTNTVTWPTGLFRGLTAFECGAFEHYPISPFHVLDVLRESPSIEFVQLIGHCNIPRGFDPPAVALQSLGECILIGQGTTSLIRFMNVPASAHVFLSKPYTDDGTIFPKFEDISAASGLGVLDKVSSVSFSIDDFAVKIRAKNSDEGVLEAEVDELYELSRDPVIFAYFLRSSFECGSTCPGFKTAKELTLNIKRGRIWEPQEATCFTLDFLGCIFNLPDVGGVTLQGLPPLELSSILRHLRGAPKFKLPCPNLKRLHIESSPLPSPRSLLVELDEFLARRKRAGAPFKSVTVKVKCEMLIPTTDHCAFLNSWKGLVKGDVKLEYEQTKVEKLPRCRRRNYEREGDRDYDEEDEWEEGCEVHR